MHIWQEFPPTLFPALYSVHITPEHLKSPQLIRMNA